MHSLLRLLIVPLLWFYLDPSEAAAADATADGAAIEALAQSWAKAFNQHDAQAMLAIATEDVVLLDARMPAISGKRAARAALNQSLASGSGRITSSTKEITVIGDIAWRVAAVAQRMRHGNVIARSQLLEIWKRDSGQWKLHRQMSSGILTRPNVLGRPRPSEPVLDRQELGNH